MAQKYIWIAEYNDGTCLSEFDGTKENSFYDIDKSKLKKIKLVGGLDECYGFDTANGIFTINGKNLTAKFGDIELMNNGLVFNDIIQYKDAVAIFSPGALNRALHDDIEKFNIGHRQKLLYNNKAIYYKFILSINNLTNEIGLEIKIAGDCSVAGDLIANFDNHEIARENVSIDPNKSYSTYIKILSGGNNVWQNI